MLRICGFKRVQKRKSRYSRGFLIFWFVFLVLLFLLILFAVRLRPMIIRLADSSITDIVTLKVNEIIGKKITEGSFNYDELVLLEKDTNGNITALVTNMAKINELQAEITNEVIMSLSNETITEIRIPLGSVSGSAFLSGVGPDIPVKILSVSSVLSEFTNEFTSAGINQTCHKIILHVDVVLDIVVPGHSTSTVVSTQVSVAETIIVGQVPSTYADLYPETDSNTP